MDKLLSFKFLKANRAITKYMNLPFVAGRHKITITQLFALWGVKNYRGYNLTDISKKLCMERTTLYRTVDKMKDLVDCNKGIGKRAPIYPKLTKQGEATLAALTGTAKDRDAELAIHTTTDLDAIIKYLDVVDEEIGYATLQEIRAYKDDFIRSCRDDRR